MKTGVQLSELDLDLIQLDLEVLLVGADVLRNP